MSKANILIVEDERVLAADLEDRLVGMGYDVCGRVASGEQALSTVERELPDLVMMDIKLEGAMDGIETAGLIKERYNVPVVFLTAFSDEYILERAKVTEPFGYILKPFQTQVLRSTIEIAIYKASMEEKLRKTNAKLKKTEEALRESDRMQGVLEMAGAVCHEMNQPLMAITGYSDLISMNISRDDPLFEKISKITELSDRLGKITRKLMTITKYETKDYLQGKIIDIEKSSNDSFVF